ncbi:MAG: hypothetical protein AB7L66_00650 [Gemmatimonadales bacterium]
MIPARIRTAAVAVAMLATVAACKKKEAAPPPAAEPAAPAPVAVSDIKTGNAIGADKMVTSPTSEFGPGDTIYVSVATTGTAASASLHAHWTFQTGQLVDSTTVMIAPTGPAVTEFHVSKASPWPKGKYKVAIFLNDGAVGEREFEVK